MPLPLLLRTSFQGKRTKCWNHQNPSRSRARQPFVTDFLPLDRHRRRRLIRPGMDCGQTLLFVVVFSMRSVCVGFYEWSQNSPKRPTNFLFIKKFTCGKNRSRMKGIHHEVFLVFSDDWGSSTRWIFDAHHHEKKESEMNSQSCRNRRDARDKRNRLDYLTLDDQISRETCCWTFPEGFDENFLKTKNFVLFLSSRWGESFHQCLGDTKKRASFTRARVFLSFSARVYDKTTSALKLLYTRLVWSFDT